MPKPTTLPKAATTSPTPQAKRVSKRSARALGQDFDDEDDTFNEPTDIFMQDAAKAPSKSTTTNDNAEYPLAPPVIKKARSLQKEPAAAQGKNKHQTVDTSSSSNGGGHGDYEDDSDGGDGGNGDNAAMAAPKRKAKQPQETKPGKKLGSRQEVLAELSSHVKPASEVRRVLRANPYATLTPAFYELLDVLHYAEPHSCLTERVLASMVYNNQTITQCLVIALPITVKLNQKQNLQVYSSCLKSLYLLWQQEKMDEMEENGQRRPLPDATWACELFAGAQLAKFYRAVSEKAQLTYNIKVLVASFELNEATVNILHGSSPLLPVAPNGPWRLELSAPQMEQLGVLTNDDAVAAVYRALLSVLGQAKILDTTDALEKLQTSGLSPREITDLVDYRLVCFALALAYWKQAEPKPRLLDVLVALRAQGAVFAHWKALGRCERRNEGFHPVVKEQNDVEDFEMSESEE